MEMIIGRYGDFLYIFSIEWLTYYLIGWLID